MKLPILAYLTCFGKMVEFCWPSRKFTSGIVFKWNLHITNQYLNANKSLESLKKVD